jgi:nucleotide-binding universal stress UspA family protein
MQKYQKLMVKIYHDEQDKESIKYAAKITKLASSKEVIFNFHKVEYPSRDSDLSSNRNEEEILSDIGSFVRKSYRGNPDTKVSYVLTSGNETLELLKIARKEDIDLIIVNKRQDRALAEKLARKAPCSVLALTDNVNPSFKNVLVLTDFSEYSKNALDVGLAFSSGQKLKKIKLLHILSIPYGYIRAGFTEKDFIEMESKWAHEEMKHFSLSVNNRGIKIETAFEVNSQVIYGVNKFVEANNIDLVVRFFIIFTNKTSV